MRGRSEVGDRGSGHIFARMGVRFTLPDGERGSMKFFPDTLLFSAPSGEGGLRGGESPEEIVVELPMLDRGTV